MARGNNDNNDSDFPSMKDSQTAGFDSIGAKNLDNALKHDLGKNSKPAHKKHGKHGNKQQELFDKNGMPNLSALAQDNQNLGNLADNMRDLDKGAGKAEDQANRMSNLANGLGKNGNLEKQLANQGRNLADAANKGPNRNKDSQSDKDKPLKGAPDADITSSTGFPSNHQDQQSNGRQGGFLGGGNNGMLNNFRPSLSSASPKGNKGNSKKQKGSHGGLSSPEQNVNKLQNGLLNRTDDLPKGIKAPSKVKKPLLKRLFDGASRHMKKIGYLAKRSFGGGFSNSGVGKAVSHVHSSLVSSLMRSTFLKGKKKSAKNVATGIMAFMIIGGGYGIGSMFVDEQKDTPDGGNIMCIFHNTGGHSYEDTGKGTNGDWTKKGTTAYKTAKGIFSAWVHQGCSGAAAAGIVGYITGEGNFKYPDQAELPFTGDKSGEISKGSVPANDHGGGGGPYQITPYTGFAPLRSKKWLDVPAQTRYFIKHKIPNWNPAYDKSGKAPTFKAFAKLTSPVDACKAWDAAEIGKPYNMQSRVDNAREAYKLFNGAEYKANLSLLGGNTSDAADSNAGKAEKSNDDKCGTGSTSSDEDNDSNMLRVAKKMIGFFTYDQVRPIPQYAGTDGHLNKFSDIDKHGRTDCSGFVWIVMKVTGHKVPPSGWTTGFMEDDARHHHKYLKAISAKDAKPGDIFIANTSGSGDGGHTAIIAGKVHGNTAKEVGHSNTAIIQEGGGSKAGVNRSTINNSFGGLSNGSCTIARPVGK